MKKIILFSFMLIVLSACGAMDQYAPLSTSESKNNQIALAFTSSKAPSATPSITSTPTLNAVQTALAVIQIDQATGTAAAAATSTSMAVTSTQEAKATQGFWVAVTLDIATQHAQETAVSKTETAGTAQADWKTQQPPIQTATKAAQILMNDKFNANRIGTWIYYVGIPVAVIVLVGLLLWWLFFYIQHKKEIGQAEVSEKEQIKPDEQGRYRLVKEGELRGEKLINPNLGFTPVLDPKAIDPLSPEQALSNANSARRLEMVRSVVASPALNRIATNLMKRTDGNGQPAMPKSDIQITKPEQPLLSMYPELPIPHWKVLNQWDGHLLPFGMDEKAQLMRVDTSVRPHFMILGRSGSGKDMASIRPMCACLLTMGWNVIVMGKRVDFMPFEEHPNFKLIAVDVRKDAQKYINILQTLSAQMDIRDQLLALKRVSTWDRYGAPQTMVVLDDYSGAIERMPSKQASEVVSEVKSIALDGRKFGLNLMMSLQKPTWENISTTIRSQMGRIVYSVDIGDSRIALGEEGAERLPLQWNFLTRMTDDSSIQRGVGFVLQDEEVEAFLKSRPVETNEQPNWIDAEVVDEVKVGAPAGDATNPTAIHANEARKMAEEEIKILDLAAQGKSVSAITREIWGVTGGGSYAPLADRVKTILDKKSSSSSHQMPQNGLEAAI